MAITTYTELQTAITRWLGGRTDLTTFYPDWIVMFEAVANRKLRTWQMETFVNQSTTTGFFNDVPTGYVGASLVARSDGTVIEPRSTEWIALNFPTRPSGDILYYAIAAGAVEFMPIDDTDTVTFTYYQRIPDLATNTTNWLLASYPDLYLFGALTEAHSFLADLEQLQIAKARRDEMIDEINMQSNFTHPYGPQMRVSARQATP